MTVEQVLKRYGSKAVATTKQGNGGPFYVVEVVERGNALVFTLEDWQGPDFTDPEDMSRLDPNAKIGRPRQVYTGYTERDYVPMDQRH